MIEEHLFPIHSQRLFLFILDMLQAPLLHIDLCGEIVQDGIAQALLEGERLSQEVQHLLLFQIVIEGPLQPPQRKFHTQESILLQF